MMTRVSICEALKMTLGTKVGNDLKVEKTVEGYDNDATLTIDYLVGLDTCNGRVGATGTLYVK
jgi:hypothetical protein